MKTIGIVCPVYREEEVIGRFHERLSGVLADLSDRYRFKIVYVLDPSPDKSEQIIAGLCSREQNVSMLVLSRRFGHQAALIAGMDRCDADALITLDSDLQHPPELIPSLLKRFESGADIVQTIRRDVANRAAFERLTSGWFYALMRRVGAVDLRSGAADYRLLSRRVVDVFRARVREQNQFVRGLVRWVGYRSEFVEFDCRPREAGRSKYGMAQLIVFAIQGICSFSKAPLRLAVLLGTGIAALGFLYGAFVVVTYFVGPMIVPGWTSLLALIALLGGFQLIFLGVIGEYIGLIFDEVKHRPLYLVDRVYGDISDPSPKGALDESR